MHINQINPNNNFAKIGFKDKDKEKDDIDSLKQRILNNRIYEIRHGTKRYNNQFSNAALVSSLAIIRASNKDTFRQVISLPLLIILVLMDFVRPLAYGSNSVYAQEILEKPLKKTPFGLIPLISTVGAGVMIGVNYFDNKIKTADDKFKNFLLGACLIGIGCLHDIITNKNVDICEEGVNQARESFMKNEI